jgi:hypothetical protein
VDGHSVDLSWSAATDNVGVDHYRIWIDGSLAAQTAALTLAGVPVADGMSHTFAVGAVDAEGNIGPRASNDLFLPDVTAPSPPGSFAAAGIDATSVWLTWLPAADNVAVVAYRLTRNGRSLPDLQPSAVSLTDAGLATDRNYLYTLTAVDAAGNAGATVTAEVALSAIDVSPPNIPVGLTAVALGGRRVQLTWIPSGDNRVGTVTYRIFRGRKRVATVGTATFIDQPAKVRRFKYRIRAVDVAGNVSAFSVAVWVKVRR